MATWLPSKVIGCEGVDRDFGSSSIEGSGLSISWVRMDAPGCGDEIGAKSWGSWGTKLSFARGTYVPSTGVLGSRVATVSTFDPDHTCQRLPQGCERMFTAVVRIAALSATLFDCDNSASIPPRAVFATLWPVRMFSAIQARNSWRKEKLPNRAGIDLPTRLETTRTTVAKSSNEHQQIPS